MINSENAFSQNKKIILFSGFTSEQSDFIEERYPSKCLFLLSNEDSSAQNRINILDLYIDNHPSSQLLYKKVIQFYSKNKKGLPHEKIDLLNLRPSFILSCQKLYSRYFNFSVIESNYSFLKLINIITYLLDAHDIRTIISRKSPENPAEYLLEKLAIERGIEVITNENFGRYKIWSIHSENNFEFLKSYLDNDSKNRLTDYILKKRIIAKDRNKLISVSYRANLFNIASAMLRNYLTLLLRSLKLCLKNTYQVGKYFFDHKNFFNFSKKRKHAYHHFMQIKLSLKGLLLLVVYNYLALKSWNLSNRVFLKSVLYLANYQPEKTSLPDAEIFSEIRVNLSSILTRESSKASLLYKEHPQTFYNLLDHFEHEHCGSLLRSYSFYREIMDMGFLLLPIEIDTHDLVDMIPKIYAISTSAIDEYYLGDKYDPQKKWVVFSKIFPNGINGIDKIAKDDENIRYSKSNLLDFHQKNIDQYFLTLPTENYEISFIKKVIEHPLIESKLRS